MSRRYLYDQIRVCLFKSKYIPGVRVERPGISGPHRAYFDFPFFFFLFLFFSFLFYFHGITTYALSRHCPSFPLHLFSTSLTLFSTRNLIALHPLGHFRTISCVSGEPDGKPQMQNPIECFNDKPNI